MTGGNWYSLWSITGEINETPYAFVVISDDDKTKSHKVPCTSGSEANSLMCRIAQELVINKRKPLWEILSIKEEDLAEPIRLYERRRLNYYQNY